MPSLLVLNIKCTSLNNITLFNTKNINSLSSSSLKNFYSKNFVRFFFFFFYYKSSTLFFKKFAVQIIKASQNTINFLKSPNRFKMARNQVSTANSVFKLVFFFDVSGKLNYSFFNANFFSLFESNFIHIKNIKYNYLKKNEKLNFYHVIKKKSLIKIIKLKSLAILLIVALIML